MPLWVWIGLACILLAAAGYGSWEWWMATRTWVPLDIPISLAEGHVRSSEFTINLDAGFWIFIEEWRTFDPDAADCLIGYGDEYCRKSHAHPLRASWTLEDSGKVVAQGSTDAYKAWRGGMASRARGLGDFAVPLGRHYVLDVNVLAGGSRFDAGHPRLWIAQRYYWQFEDRRPFVVFLAATVAAIGAGLLAGTIGERIRRKRQAERVSLTAPGPLPGALVFLAAGSDQEPSAAAGTRRFPPSVWLGLACVVLGCSTFFSVRHWYNTRTFVPVDMPVSLAAGHIRTGPFRLNLSTDYWITVDAGDWWRTGSSCTATYPDLRTRWVLYQNGSVVDRQEDPRHGDWTGFFEARPGVYEADVEVLSEFRCLDLGHPRLRITALRDDCDTWVFVLKTLAAASLFVGFVLLVFLPLIRFAHSFEQTDFEKASEVTASLSVGQDFPWARRLPLRRAITGLPNFGLVVAIIFALLTMDMMLLAPLTPLGLWVHLLKPGQVPAKSDSWTDPLMVRLVDEGAGKEPKLLVNSKPVRWDDLRDTLKRELSLRPDWTVYVEGDECIPWGNVTAVVDIARGLHAKVVLFTYGKQKPC